MTVFIEVVVPGPWWHSLTYESRHHCSRGIRLKVPVRKTERIAFSTGVSTELPPSGEFKIFKAGEIIDEAPVMGWELFDTAERLGRHFLCGFGESLKSVMPCDVLSGVRLGPFPEMGTPSGNFSEESCDFPRFSDRAGFYNDVISSVKGNVLALFPDKGSAHSFWEGLPDPLKGESLFWGSNSGPAAMKRWERTRRGEVRIVVGSPAAVFAPLRSIEAVILDDEGNPSYRSQRFPFINARSAAGSRAQAWGARLIMGGGLPSSRSFFRNPRPCPENPGGRIIFVDINKSRKIIVPGVHTPLPVSDSALKRTQAIVAEGKTVLWILDRKGYSGALVCSECGRTMVCNSCGLPVRWDDSEGIFRCGFCGVTRPWSDICPFCGAISLEGTRPGLESLFQIGENLLGGKCPIFPWHADIKQATSTKRALISGLSSGGLVIGSRRSLELCNHLNVGLICWLDADTAVNSPSYDVKSLAFRMVWESAWRGHDHQARTVLVQSRAPGSGWQKGLVSGWDHFWRTELVERKELGLPPWKFLIEIKKLGQVKSRARDLLAGAGIECLDPEPAGDILWARSDSLSPVRRSLEPLFRISGSGRGFPRITIWAD